jgi:hypothetical protein
MGKQFELRIDHSGLEYLFQKPNLNVIQSGWLDFLSEYDFYIKHIKGKVNKVVDALCRRVPEMQATIISMCKYDLNVRIMEAGKSY